MQYLKMKTTILNVNNVKFPKSRSKTIIYREQTAPRSAGSNRQTKTAGPIATFPRQRVTTRLQAELNYITRGES